MGTTKIIRPILVTTEGFDKETLNAVMVEHSYRKVSDLELILLNVATVHVSSSLELSSEALTDKKDTRAYTFRKLMVKLLHEFTNLTDEQICLLFGMDKTSVQNITNHLLPNLEANTHFMKQYSQLKQVVIINERLAFGSNATNPDLVVTRRIRVARTAH